MQLSRRSGAPSLRDAESGFTLVEVVVALLLIAILMTSLAALFYASMRTAATANRRTEATGIATRELESMRALPYPALGFYTNQSAADDGFGEPVNIGATAPSDVLFTPSGAAKPGPTTFSISRFVVWGNASDTKPRAYKRTRVRVSWTDQVGPHSVAQDSVVYPGSCGAYADRNACGSPVSPTIGIAPDAPTNVVVSLPADPIIARTTVNVSWTPPAAGITPAGYVVEFSSDSSIWIPTIQLSSSATSSVVSPLASGTSYSFRVLAVSSDGMFSIPSASSPTTTIATATAPPSGCTVTGLRVSGADTKNTTKVYLTQTTNRMSENLNLHVSTNRECGNTITVRSVVTATGAADPESPWTPIAFGTGGGYSTVATTDNDLGWSAGSHTFTVYRNNNPASGPITHTFVVCQYKALQQRSPLAGQC